MKRKLLLLFVPKGLVKKLFLLIRSLNISIGKCGSISINLKFESGEDLNKFEENSKEFFQDLKKTFIFKQSDFSGIYVYNYDSEITSTDISLN